MLVFSIAYTRSAYVVSPVSDALFVPVFLLLLYSIDIMGKSKDKRSSASPPAGSIYESYSQPSSGFPPRTFSNMAAPAPLSSQGGLGGFSLIEGCTRFPSAIDEEGVNNPPSDRINLDLPVPQTELNFALFNKFLAFANSNSGASIPTVSAPAALGASPQIDVSASYLPSGVLTRPGPTAIPDPWSAVRHGQSTPRVVTTPSSLIDQRGRIETRAHYHCSATPNRIRLRV